MPAHSSISGLSPVSRKRCPVELCSDLVQQDADIFRLGTGGRQGENFLQLSAKMRARHRFTKGSDLGFFEFALALRHDAAVKTILLRRQFHPSTALIVWLTNTCAKRRAHDFAAFRPLTRRLLAPFTPKTSDASFCSLHHTATQKFTQGEEQP